MESSGIFQPPFFHFKLVTSLSEIELFHFSLNCHNALCVSHNSRRILLKERFKKNNQKYIKTFSRIQILLSTSPNYHFRLSSIFQKIISRPYFFFANNKFFVTNLTSVFRWSYADLRDIIFIEGISLSSPILEWYSRTRVSTFSYVTRQTRGGTCWWGARILIAVEPWHDIRWRNLLARKRQRTPTRKIS